MSDLGKRNRIFPVLQRVYSLLTLLTAGAFLLQTILAYREGTASGTQCFNPAIVRARFLPLLPLILLLCGGLLALLLLRRKQSAASPSPVPIPPYMTEARLRKQLPEAFAAQLAPFRKKLWLLRLLSILLYGLLSGLLLSYFCDPAHFPAASVTKEILRAAGFVLPLCLLLLLTAFLQSILRDRLLRKLIEKEKALLRETPKQNVLSPENAKKANKRCIFSRCVLVILGIILLLIGIFGGGLQEVFIKATKICTECIGLG